MALFGGFAFGYIALNFYSSGNIYERGYRLGIIQPYDFTGQLMNDYGRNDDAQYLTMHRKLMQEMLDKKGNLDVIDWLILGTHYSKAGEEEVAYQCFYQAHLLEHDKIETNSDLKFDTLGENF